MVDPRPTLRTAIAAIPKACYVRPGWKGALYLGRAVALYALVLAALVVTDNPIALVVLWPLAGLCISGLFVLGHDAAHAALVDGPRANRAVALLALLPSLHALAPWVAGHNRIHHVHTGRRGLDFVWHPLTTAEFHALSRPARLRHHLEWSVFGAGIYYLRVIWWSGMMCLAPPPRFVAAFRRDRCLVIVYALVWSAAGVTVGFVVGGTVAAGAWMWLKLCLVPWLCWNYCIGATVYVNHIAPETRWAADPSWSRFGGQVLATTTYLVPGWYNVFAHNIYVHVPHHVDPRIPFYKLPAAAAALEAEYPQFVHTRRLRLRDYVATTRVCKLYDFDRTAWCGYDGTPVRADG